MRYKTNMVSALILILMCIGSIPAPVAAAGNDYPNYLKNAYMDSEYDPWGFLNRECTSFVAWRLNHDNRFAFSNTMRGGWFGDAENWGYNARNLHYAVDTTPANGAVLWEPASYGDPWGHVAWVRHVNTVAQSVKVATKVYYYKQVGDYGGNPLYGRFYNIVYVTKIVQVPVSVTIEEYNHFWTGTYGSRIFPASGYRYIHFKDL